MAPRLVKAPPNFFSIPFGLCGLATVWRVMADLHGTPTAVAAVLYALAAAAWVVLLAASAARIVPVPRRLAEEVADPALSPFWACRASSACSWRSGSSPTRAGRRRSPSSSSSR